MGFWSRLTGRRAAAVQSPGEREPTFAELKKEAGRSDSYVAAAINRLTGDWTITGYSADNEMRRSIKLLRDRSRELARNNDYVRGYLRLLARHVIGPHGIGLEMKIVTPGGKPDKRANELIEAAWEAWGKKGICTVDGQHSWRSLQHIWIQTVARDGEAIIRIVRGYGGNDQRFALQLLEADYLDVNYNRDDLDDGRFVRMGIEFDRFRRPVAYWLRTQHPGDYPFQSPGNASGDFIRVPASDIIHAFLPDRSQQTRGMPWTHTAMLRLKMLSGLEEAALTAARTGAAKMGFYTRVTEDGVEPADRETDQSGNLIDQVEPGQMEVLPVGYDFKTFDPNYPNGEFPGFVKAMLRGSSVGLGVSYSTFANDLESLNYSSIRAGVLDERDEMRVHQMWTIETLHSRVFTEWLAWLLTIGKLPPYGGDQIDRLDQPKWQPRGWQWVDPAKDVQALTASVALGVKSRTQAAAEQGRDIEDVFEELLAEQALAKAMGLTLIDPIPGGKTATVPQTETPPPAASPDSGEPADEPVDEPDDTEITGD